MWIEADHERCIASGVCVLTARSVFDQNAEDGRVLLLTDRPGPESAEAVLQAVALCPSGALSLRDEGRTTPMERT